jgi:hypothetical protein
MKGMPHINKFFLLAFFSNLLVEDLPVPPRAIGQ